MQPRAMFLTLGSALLAFAWSVAPAHPPKADAAAIAISIANPDRTAADRERDSWAKPQVVLDFLEARPGMQVIDYLAGNGYYSDLLGRVVGPTGQVIVFNNAGYAAYMGQELTQRFAGRRVPNTLFKVTEIAALKLPPNSLDAALFVRAYHDVYYTMEGTAGPMGDASTMIANLYTALKPGGVVVVQDHVANAGSDPVESVNKLHRIDPGVVKGTFEQAGFKLEAQDGTFGNAADDHSKLVFDPAIRHQTDQFMYRFRKPK
jgi:predicted methyltransferase